MGVASNELGWGPLMNWKRVLTVGLQILIGYFFIAWFFFIISVMLVLIAFKGIVRL